MIDLLTENKCVPYKELQGRRLKTELETKLETGQETFLSGLKTKETRQETFLSKLKDGLQTSS